MRPEFLPKGGSRNLHDEINYGGVTRHNILNTRLQQPYSGQRRRTAFLEVYSHQCMAEARHGQPVSSTSHTNYAS